MTTPLHHFRAARFAALAVVAASLAWSTATVRAGDDDQRIQFAPGTDQGSVSGTFSEGAVDNFVLRAGVRGFVLKSDTERHLIAALDALSIHRPYFSGAISETLLEKFLESKPQPAASSLTTACVEWLRRANSSIDAKGASARACSMARPVASRSPRIMRSPRRRETPWGEAAGSSVQSHWL